MTKANADLRREVLDLTGRIGHAARRADWHEVQHLLDRRDELLNGDIAAAEVVFADILRSDRAVRNLALVERDRIKRELEKISQGRRAIKAYRDSQR